MPITITPRPKEALRKGVLFNGTLSADNAVALDVLAETLGEEKTYIVNQAISHIALSEDQRAKVDAKLRKIDEETATMRPSTRGTRKPHKASESRTT